MSRPTGRLTRPPNPIGGAATGNYHAHALTRGLLILELLGADAPPMTLSALHARTGLPKSTLVRLLRALVELQFVVRVDERPAYRLGHKVLALAQAYVSALDISQAAGNYLAALSDSTRQTSNLGVLDGDQVVHVCVRVPERPLRFHTAAGARAHTYCTGLGKMLLAAVDPGAVESHLPPGPLERFTKQTIGERGWLHRELRLTRARGYAIDDNEHSDGLRCLAVPVTAGGVALAAVSVSGPSAEFESDERVRLLALLRAAAADLAADPDVVNALHEIRSRTRGGRT